MGFLFSFPFENVLSERLLALVGEGPSLSLGQLVSQMC